MNKIAQILNARFKKAPTIDGEARTQHDRMFHSFERLHGQYVPTEEESRAQNRHFELQEQIKKLREDFFANSVRPKKRQNKVGETAAAIACTGETDANTLSKFLAQAIGILKDDVANGSELLREGDQITIECGGLHVLGPFHLKVTDAQLISATESRINLSGAHFDSISLYCTTYIDDFLLRPPPAKPPYLESIEIDLSGAVIEGDFSVRGPCWTIRAPRINCKTLSLDDALGTFYFMNCIVKENAYGARCRFRSLNLEGSTLNGGFYARQCWFLSDINLDQSKILDRLHFIKCLFFLLPRLHDATIPSNFTLIGSMCLIELGRRRRRKLLKKANSQNGIRYYYQVRQDFFSLDDLSTTAIDSARALRVAMRKAGAHEQEGRFFALEMRLKRLQPVDWKEKIDIFISWIYDAVSLYGTSPARALYVFFLWNISYGILFEILQKISIPIGFGWHFGIPADAITANGSAFEGGGAFGLALQNSVNPFAIFNSSPAVKVSNASIVLLSLLQSLGSLGVGALFLLAIKNKFQRGGN